MTNTPFPPGYWASLNAGPGIPPAQPAPTMPTAADMMMTELQQAQELTATKKKLDRYLKIADVPVADRPVKRRLFQPKFKLQFDSAHDIDMRLRGTILYVGADTYYVNSIVEYDNDYLLIVEDWKGDTFKVLYSHPSIDLRNPEPQYIVANDCPAFLARRPSRQQKQGMSYDNTLLRQVNTGRYTRPDSMHVVLKGLASSDTIRWEATYHELMVKALAFPSLRLSPTIAFFRDKKNNVKAEFKGRLLGDVNDNEVKVDEMDYGKPWISRELQHVGCVVRRQ